MASVRQARIKIPAAEGEAGYHCTTRAVNGERLFDDTAKKILRRQVWQVTDYCGVQILTYAIMSNHFPVLIRVPRQEPVSDEELLRRFGVLYPKPTAYQTARLDVVKRELAGSEIAQAGIRAVIGGGNWEAVQSQYRQLLFQPGQDHAPQREAWRRATSSE
jgi:hypothetical protein